jgi:mRNA interferase MazF
VNRGDVFLVRKPSQSDPKRQRAFVVVSRQALIESNYDTVICAPVYTKHLGLQSQVAVGDAEGLKHDSAVHCDALVSIAKSRLTDFRGTLSQVQLEALNDALKVALDLE